MRWNSSEVRALVCQGLSEDASRHDITTLALIPPSLFLEADIRAGQNGIVCGLPLAAIFFKSLDSRCRFRAAAREGGRVKRGACLALIRGPARAILSAERPALNTIQHLSGIATYTRQQVDRLRPFRTKLLDTRKTLPGWRDLQKYAVKCGGGTNHRRSLGDAFLIKENHLRICREAGLDWIASLRKLGPGRMRELEIEIQSDRDLRDVLRLRPGRVLLDNMSILRLRGVLKTLRRQLPDLKIEVSGGVDPSQLKALARLRVHYISMGRLTHSAPAFDCSLNITRVFAR